MYVQRRHRQRISYTDSVTCLSLTYLIKRGVLAQGDVKVHGAHRVFHVGKNGHRAEEEGALLGMARHLIRGALARSLDAKEVQEGRAQSIDERYGDKVINT